MNINMDSINDTKTDMENFAKKQNIEKAKKISVVEGSAYGIMDGFGLRYITPYALALKAPNFAIGILSSLPQLIGNISQIFSLRLMKKYSRKRIILAAVISQTFLWLPLIIIGLLSYFFKLNQNLAIILLIVSYTFLTMSGSMASPAWNSWMKDLVKEKSGSYFGNRNRIINLITVVSMLIAGIILNYFENTNIILGFLIIFSIAFLGRVYSAYLLNRQYEPAFKLEEEFYFNAIEFARKIRSNNFGRFVIFVSLISLSTSIAAPFFSVYMLKELNFSYIEFTLVTLSSVATTIMFMPFWGRRIDKVGTVKVMKITGIFLFLVPAGYILTIFLLKYSLPNFLLPLLILTEALSGFIWAGFNLSAANFIFDAVTRQRMAICTAYYNLANAIGTFIGAIIGGILASIDFHSAVSSLIIVFIISGLGRFILYLIMNHKIKEVRIMHKEN